MIDFSFDQLWLNAIAAIPMAIVVAMVCRCVPCRPSTRHTLWVLVLAMFLLPSLAVGFQSGTQLSVAPQQPAVNHAEPHAAPAHRTIERRGEQVGTDIWAGFIEDGSDETDVADPSSFAKGDRSAGPAAFDSPKTGDAPAANDTEAERNALPAEPSDAGADRWFAAIISVRDSIAGIPPLPASIWAGGIGVVLLLTLLRIITITRLLRRAERAPVEVARLVHRAADEIGLERAPRALMIDARISPMLWCGSQPTLVLPFTLWEQLDHAGRYAVVCHELAHLRRRDHWVRWFEMSISTIYWWNPIVWWLRRRIRDEADYCCDAWVTHLMPTERRSYAEALLESRKFLSTHALSGPAVGLGARGMHARSFARRLTMVMTHQIAPRLSFRGLALAATLGVGACLVTPITACPPEEDPAMQESPAAPARTRATFITDATKGQSIYSSRSPAVGFVTTTTAEMPVEAEATTFEVYSRTPGQPGGDDLEARIDRLERRMDQLMQSIERMLGPSAAPPGADAAPTPARRPSGGTTARPAAPDQPMPRGVGGGAVAPRSQPAPPQPGLDGGGSGLGRGAGGGRVVTAVPSGAPLTRSVPAVPAAPTFVGDVVADGGPVVQRRYYLPEGKLTELSELMIRADVPVLVAPHDEYIEVHGTERQHQIFRAFCDLIHPEGVTVQENAVGTGAR